MMKKKPQKVTCPSCNGTGTKTIRKGKTLITVACTSCGGRGYYWV